MGLGTDAVTDPALVVDVALSGLARQFGLSYVVGLHNLFDWRYQLPITDPNVSPAIAQRGRTFMAEVSLSYPPP